MAVGPGAMFSLVAMGTNVMYALGSGLPSRVTRPETLATLYGLPPQPASRASSNGLSKRSRIEQCLRPVGGETGGRAGRIDPFPTTGGGPGRVLKREVHHFAV